MYGGRSAQESGPGKPCPARFPLAPCVLLLFHHVAGGGCPQCPAGCSPRRPACHESRTLGDEWPHEAIPGFENGFMKQQRRGCVFYKQFTKLLGHMSPRGFPKTRQIYSCFWKAVKFLTLFFTFNLIELVLIVNVPLGLLKTPHRRTAPLSPGGRRGACLCRCSALNTSSASSWRNTHSVKHCSPHVRSEVD